MAKLDAGLPLSRTQRTVQKEVAKTVAELAGALAELMAVTEAVRANGDAHWPERYFDAMHAGLAALAKVKP